MGHSWSIDMTIHAQIAFEMLVTFGIAMSIVFLMAYMTGSHYRASHVSDLNDTSAVTNATAEISAMSKSELRDGYVLINQ